MKEQRFKEVKFLSNSIEIVDINGIGRTHVLPILTIYLFPDSKIDLNNPLAFTKPIKIARYEMEPYAGEKEGVIYLDSKIIISEKPDGIIFETFN